MLFAFDFAYLFIITRFQYYMNLVRELHMFTEVPQYSVRPYYIERETTQLCVNSKKQSLHFYISRAHCNGNKH